MWLRLKELIPWRRQQATAELPDEELLHHTGEAYDVSQYNAALLDQYKLYVQSVENLDAREMASSRYLLAVNTAIIALYCFGPNILNAHPVIKIFILQLGLSV